MFGVFDVFFYAGVFRFKKELPGGTSETFTGHIYFTLGVPLSSGG